MSATVETPLTCSGFPEALKPIRERLLSNLVMIARIPAPTGGEAARARFLLDRFVEAGLSDAAADEAGNAIGRINGRQHNRTILLVSHLDTVYPASVNHEVVVEAHRVIAPGVGDNAMGAAVLAMLPAVLEHLGLRLDSDVLLLGCTRSLGRGNRAGIRFFLDHWHEKIDYGVCVEGMQLGRVNYFSIGTVRADIICSVHSHGEASRSYGSESALVVLNHIINRILSIPLPARPFTKIKLGKLRAGMYYDVEPDRAELGMEIVSHSDGMIEQLCGQIDAIVAEMSARHAVKARFDKFFSTAAGGIPFSHPLVKSVLEVMNQLGIEPDQGHSPSELSELVARRIPAVTLGITHGMKNQENEPDYVLIDPILTGVAQLVGLLLAIDEGRCDEIATVAR